jgi:hypothetical protein
MRTLTRGLTVAILAAGMQACGSPEPERSTGADTLSRAQRDSITASLPIPGAGAVGAALRAGDAAAARAEAHDSIGG